MEIFSEFKATVRDLATDGRWRDFLAENIYWASCEAYLQSSLLAAFNLRGTPVGTGLPVSPYVVDRERALRSGVQIDLLVMNRADQDRWWEARSTTPIQHELLTELCVAAVELKVVWTEGKSNASITSKVKSVKRDMDKLQTLGSIEKHLVVLASGFHEEGLGSGKVDEALAFVVEELEGNPVEQFTADLLVEHHSRHWPVDPGVPRRLATSKLLWMRF